MCVLFCFSFTFLGISHDRVSYQLALFTIVPEISSSLHVIRSLFLSRIRGMGRSSRTRFPGGV